ncbi:hypothetical protein RF371_09880 [Companilactobacillus paralimentarius]|uniref:hypothetical protein n=1 Tax=Companilactobacillus paralimentarius TaxID=83526 RepID=UPI00285315BB|nr:hypothetical protein [Companilactobacillus paralimentarius]MDR4934104.1 hypothetical protein [Companilactobacillus paralimentarius]
MLKLKVIISAVLALISIVIFIFKVLPEIKRIRKYNKAVNGPKLYRWTADIMEEYPQEYKRMKRSMYIWVCLYLLLICSIVLGVTGFYVVLNYYDYSLIKIFAILMIVFSLAYLYTYRLYAQNRISLCQLVLKKSSDQFVEDRLKMIKSSEISNRYRMLGMIMLGVALAIVL